MWVTVDQGGYQSETHTHWYAYPVTTARTVQVPVDDGVADEPAGWRSWLSIRVDFIPVVGNIKSAIEAATGRDFIAGEDLGALERAAATAGIFAGGLSKTAAKGAMAGAVAVTEAVARRAAKSGGRTTTDVLSNVVVRSHGKVVARGNVDLSRTLDDISTGRLRPRTVFKNREGLLPERPRGYYQEFVHRTPGVEGPGAQRIVRDREGELYYTPDHYESFVPLN